MQMSDVYSDIYWTDEFDITTADLERIARRMRETCSAYDLTELAKRVVRGRLRHGPEQSPAVLPPWADDPSVRLWDPAEEWKERDHVIVARLVRRDVYGAFVGEIVAVEPHQIRMKLDKVECPAIYLRAAPGSEQARRWHAKVREVVAEKRRASELEEQTDLVLLEHGQRIVSRLLDALQADEHFVCLAGRWYLRELAVPPSEEQIAALAWAMLKLSDPQPTEALIPLVQPPLPEGDASLFGLYLAMRQRPNLFANADPGQRPRWVLAGPPPGSFTPRYTAYDPETYQVLCLPGEPVSPDVVKRLWELDLLQAVA
jgi:hypothetical protein